MTTSPASPDLSSTRHFGPTDALNLALKFSIRRSSMLPILYASSLLTLNCRTTEKSGAVVLADSWRGGVGAFPMPVMSQVHEPHVF